MNKLNNLFPTDESIDEAIRYLDTGAIPSDANPKQCATKYKRFILNSNKQIVYKPLELVVLRKAEIQPTLKRLYHDDANAFGKGIIAVYKYVCSKFINITREDVETFLKAQTPYQLTRTITKRINKPIVADYPNQLWCIDLIDLNPYIGHNYQFRYIVNVVDAFSRKVWLEKLRVKGSKQVAREFAKICDRAGIRPTYLLSDNGTEFKDEMSQYCKAHGIKQRLTRTYSPEANGICERANRDIEKLIRAYMVRDNTQNWTKVLHEIEDSKNHTYNKNIKSAPDEVWSANKNPVDETNIPEVITKADKPAVAKAHVLHRVMKQIEKFQHEDNYQVGDMVRLKMSSIFSNVRKLVKDKNTKQIVVAYSPKIYRVSRVIVPRRGLLERKRYVLTKEHGEPIRSAGSNKAKNFYANEMIRAHDAPVADITMEQALKLNQVEPNRHDLIY
jgi:transposase InsO family protein